MADCGGRAVAGRSHARARTISNSLGFAGLSLCLGSWHGWQTTSASVRNTDVHADKCRFICCSEGALLEPRIRSLPRDIQISSAELGLGSCLMSCSSDGTEVGTVVGRLQAILKPRVCRSEKPTKDTSALHEEASGEQLHLPRP